jgi:lysophospholipase L1-like esterase
MEAARALSGKPQYYVEKSAPSWHSQTLSELLTILKPELNQRSAGLTFATSRFRRGWLSRPSSTEAPALIVVFIGANDLMASFESWRATPTDPHTFRTQYAELVGRLRAVMASDAPANQLLVATLPDVTVLPFLQELPPTADNGDGARYPEGSKASTFLIPYRTHFEASEVWTPDEMEDIRHRAHEYNAAIVEIASERGVTVLDMAAVSAHMAEDSAFSTPDSPYFSPDLHHPSYRAHRVIANHVMETMASIAGAPVPDMLEPPQPPLPSADELARQRRRVNALMHLGMQGLKIGPLPRKFTARFSADAGWQGGDERIGDAVVVAMAGIEGLPVPVSTRHVMRIHAHGRATVASFHADDENANSSHSRSRGPPQAFEANRWLELEPVRAGRTDHAGDSVDFGL